MNIIDNKQFLSGRRWPGDSKDGLGSAFMSYPHPELPWKKNDRFQGVINRKQPEIDFGRPLARDEPP